MFLVDFDSWKVVNVFNEQQQLKQLNGGFLYMFGERMCVCHSKGLSLWQIETPKLERSFEQDLSLAKYFKPLGWNSILVVTKDHFFYHIILSNFKIVDRRRLNKKITDFKFFFEDFIVAVVKRANTTELYVGRISIMNDVILQEKGKIFEVENEAFKLLNVSQIFNSKIPAFYVAIEKQNGIFVRIRIEFKENKNVSNNESPDQTNEIPKSKHFFEEINEFEFGKSYKVQNNMNLCPLTIRQKLIKKLGSDIESETFQLKMIGKRIKTRIFDAAQQNMSKGNESFQRRSILPDQENKYALLEKKLKGERFPSTTEIKRIDLKQTQVSQTPAKGLTTSKSAKKHTKSEDLSILNQNFMSESIKNLKDSEIKFNLFKDLKATNTKNSNSHLKETTIKSLNQTLDKIELNNPEIEDQTHKINVVSKQPFVLPLFKQLNLSLSDTQNSGKFEGIVDDMRQITNHDIVFLARKYADISSPSQYILRLEAIQLKSDLNPQFFKKPTKGFRLLSTITKFKRNICSRS